MHLEAKMQGDPSTHREEVRMRFNAAAAGYDAGPGVFAHFGRRLAAAAEIAAGDRVLDVASGHGAVLFPAIQQAGETGEVIGVDFAEEMVRAANERAAGLALGPRVRVMDAENLEFPDGSFDRVLCGFGIMFFPDQARALAEFRRVLKSGGRVAISTWQTHQASEVEAALIAAGVVVPRMPGWIPESADLAELLIAAGFDSVKVDADAFSFRYQDAEEYWQQARGTGMRRTLDALDQTTTEQVRATLVERMRPHHKDDGFHLGATALLATATR
jgi:ubiquinone/menaquinone biosynthesis C-methylase UbiE